MLFRSYGRTVHSLIVGMSHFNPTFNFIAPNELRMPDEQKNFCDKHGIKYNEYTEFTEDIINQTDILYMTRVQRERFTDLEEYERVKNVYILKNEMLKNSRENLRIRIGVNHGSLSDRIMSRYGDTPEGMVESCMEFLRICVQENFTDVDRKSTRLNSSHAT